MKRVPVLANCEERHRKQPRRFEIPSLNYRTTLEVGDMVKLIWEDQNNDQGECGERMWVEIIAVNPVRTGKPRYKGKLGNTPVYFADSMKYGMEIDFGPEHIAEID